MRKRTKKQLSTKPSHTDIAAPMIGLTVTMPELHILQVASVYRLHRRDGGWWWPVGHPIWGQEVEPIPVFPPIGVENLLVRGLLRRVDTDDFGIGDRGYEDGGLEDFERARIVETSEAGKSMLFDPSDVSTQAARRLVTLWRRVDTLDEITQGW